MAEPIPFISAEQRKMMIRAGGADATTSNLPEGMRAAPILPLTAEEVKRRRLLEEKKRNDVRKLQLLTARVQKAIGNNMESDIIVGACVHVLAQVVCQIPREAHSTILQNIVHGLETAIISSYPQELIDKMKAEHEAQLVKVGDNVINQMADQIAVNYPQDVMNMSSAKVEGGLAPSPGDGEPSGVQPKDQ